jgi:hypothetical protein
VGDDVADDWVRRPVALHYRVGELTLWSKRFAGIVDDRHFTEVECGSALPDPASAPARASEVVFLPSYPIASRPPPTVVMRGRWIVYTPEWFTNYYLDLARFESFDAYMTHFSRRSRGTLRRKVRLFVDAAGGKLAWRSFERPEAFDQFFAAAAGISAKTYQERISRTGLPRSPAFIAATKARAAAGEAFAYLLDLHGAPVAFALCRKRRGVVTYDHIGYDPAHARLSPGIVLHYVILEALFAKREIRIFDFAPGISEHKRVFSSDGVPCATTYLLPRTLGNALYVGSHVALSRSVAGIGMGLHRLRLKVRVRHAMRALEVHGKR